MVTWGHSISGFCDGLQREKAVLRYGNTVKRTTHFIADDCERETMPAYSRYVDYIRADGRVVALHVYNTTASLDRFYYVQTDLCGSRAQSQACLSYAEMEQSVSSKMLGSWERVVSGLTVVQGSHYDPWGNRMSASDWSLAQDGTAFLFHRGFTGHEHYDRFSIINMNARLYDPVIARFFSPDPQVQNPTSTQGFNRYSYCNNNPVMNTDPDGESFIIDSWIHGFVIGLFDNKYTSAWSSANHHALNDIKIWGGLFVPNSNKNFWGQAWEIISRFTWQAPQTLAGFKYAQICNNYHAWGGIDNISYYDGATVITNFKTGEAAVTLGSYINGKNSLAPDPGNSTFQHEYGHYIQSQEMGLTYLARIGFPSIMSNSDHDYRPVEIDANRRAFQYFNEYVHGFYSTEAEWKMWDAGETSSYYGWDFSYNPLKPKGQSKYVDYYITKLDYLHAKWYDYLWLIKGPAGTILDGLCLGIDYNVKY